MADPASTIVGRMPEGVLAYRVVGSATTTEERALRAPRAAEVVVEIAGSALGAAPGCETAGRVIAAGEAASEWIGRRVVVPRLLPCGECDACRRGRVVGCRAPAARDGIATHETVAARYLLSVEPPLWPEGASLGALAALPDAAGTPWGALVRAQLAPGEVCVVLGAGVRGRFAAVIARARGAHAILVEPGAERRALAASAGLTAVDAAGLDDGALLRLVHDEASARGLGAVELKVFDTTSTAAGRARAIGLAADHGVAVLLDGGDGLAGTAGLAAIADGEGAVLGAAACHPDLLPELAALLVRGDLAVAPEVVAWPFADLAGALAAVREGRELRLPVLTPSGAFD